MWNITTRNLNEFKDIFESRRTETSNFMYMSRNLDNVVSPFNQLTKLTPTQLKYEVLKSRTITNLIDTFSKNHNIPKNEVYQQIKLILDEIGFKKDYNVIRWFGLVLIKICLKVSSGIFINETAIFTLRKNMGKVPIVYVPSHRSYADFVLMSYICFTYDIEIPAIAAGMDFHAMWVMGKLLRDTGAFFMRRSFNGDRLYWDTFQEYVYTVISKSAQGIEFFLEGTRSRSGKSLVPKTGLLSMILEAYFKSDVADILFVPINFSYDRVLEEKLFAYELLGVPKPKESTSGFFKSLSLMNENYGSIYVDFGKPISVNEYFAGKIDKMLHNMKPKHVHFITDNEKLVLQMLANEIIYSQQKHCTITTFNLISLILMNNLVSQKSTLHVDMLRSEILWIKEILEKFGALVALNDVDIDIYNSLRTHKNLVQINDEKNVVIVENKILLNLDNMTKFKAHVLSNDTMTVAVPYFMLQIYVNPTLHYFINTSIIILILKLHETIDEDDLRKEFHSIREIFAKEFVFAEYLEEHEFNETFLRMIDLDLIRKRSSNYMKGENSKLSEFLSKLLDPFILSYYIVIQYLNQVNADFCEKDIYIWCQSQLEQALTLDTVFVHPYSLCLDTLSNCLQSFVTLRILSKMKSESGVRFILNKHHLINVTLKFEQYLPSVYIENFKVLTQMRNKL